jgi:hypothetical protein
MHIRTPRDIAGEQEQHDLATHGLALGRKLCLARARPRPTTPANPTKGHFFNCVLHGCKPYNRLSHSLRKTSASPERGFGLDNTDERTPDVTRSCRADVGYPTYCQELFCHTCHCSNHYNSDNSSIRQGRARDRALSTGLDSMLSQRCKYRNRTFPSRLKSTASIKAILARGTRTHPLSHMRQAPTLLVALLGVINRGFQGFRQGENTSRFSPPHIYWHSA